MKIATCLADKSTWAVKIIDKSALGADDKSALQVECDTMLMVDHANIVCLKEVFDNDKKFFMILEICSGGELFDRIVEVEHYTEKQAQMTFSQMVEAIGHCHLHKIVHRDLKPENLLYAQPSPNMELKLADFGLASILTPIKSLHTACGTPGYVAPEILEGGDYGKEVDVWSLGVILYILLCGFPPFYEEHTPKLFSIIKKGEYNFPSPYFDIVSESAKDLIKKILVVDPKVRLTCAQIFEHPWMKEQNIGDDGMEVSEPRAKRARLEENENTTKLTHFHFFRSAQLVHFRGNMRKYNAKRKFKAAVHATMVANTLKNLVNFGKKNNKNEVIAETPANRVVTIVEPETTTVVGC